MAEKPLITVERTATVATITLDRAEKRNALSREMIRQLHAAFLTLQQEDAVRVVILTGRGNVFCAGMDLDELRRTVEVQAEAEMVWEDAQRLSALYCLIYEFPKPTIAAVNGTAVAGGAGLVSVCDLALSVPTALFGYPEVRRGLVAAMVLPHLLRHVGERMARWMLLSGELISAERALQVGFLNDVVLAEELTTTAHRWAAWCCEGGPLALAKTKELLRRCSVQAMPVAELAHASAEPRLTAECQGGLRAFFEKQPAPWLG